VRTSALLNDFHVYCFDDDFALRLIRFCLLSAHRQAVAALDPTTLRARVGRGAAPCREAATREASAGASGL
jgi:hypothetical protein